MKKNEAVEGDVTHLIEHLESQGSRKGVRLEALFAFIEDGFLTVNGEVHSTHGATSAQEIELTVTAYDSTRLVVAKDESFVEVDKSYPFELFQTEVELPHFQLSRICVSANISISPLEAALQRFSGYAVDDEEEQRKVRGFESIVVGIKYHRGHTDGLTVGEHVQLFREPANIYDTNAVQVRLSTGEILGYIPSELAVRLARELDAGMCARAQISRCNAKKAHIEIVVWKTEKELEQFLLEKQKPAQQ